MLKGKGLLTSAQREILHLLGRLPDIEHFYLTGGTALAEFYLGHRLSFDLDLFTVEEAIVRPFSLQVERALQAAKWRVEVSRRFSTFVEMVVAVDDEEVRLDLAFDTPYRFAPPVPSIYGVPVNDREDLQAEKTLAYYGRAEMRDAVDLYFLLQETSLEGLMQLAAQKDTGFDRYWFAVALQRAESFPDELERWPVRMVRDFDPRALKLQFLDMARRLLDRVLGGANGD